MIFKKEPGETALEKAIDEAVSWLDPNTDDYTQMVTNIERLHKLKEKDTPPRISPDTVLIVLGNIVGIVMILGYEHAHVVSSKALSFVLKMK